MKASNFEDVGQIRRRSGISIKIKMRAEHLHVVSTVVVV
jgi:hypothetical protein